MSSKRNTQDVDWGKEVRKTDELVLQKLSLQGVAWQEGAK
jgi:hypothetical protein